MPYTSRAIYLKAPLFLVSEMQNAIDLFLKKWLKKHTMKDGKPLYHYTDLTGLKGILSDRGLWLSHISTLNDPLELKYGQNLVNEALDEFILKEDDIYVREFYNSIKGMVNSFGNFAQQTFIACFCESDNLLSQSRAYSNNGGGYSIGFKINDSCKVSFDKKYVKKGYKPLLRKIIYKTDEQLKLIRDCIKKITIGCQEGLVGEESRRREKHDLSAAMGVLASNILLDLILSFKNPVFEEEQEWRLIHVVSENHEPEKFQFRENINGLIPYKQSFLFDKKDDVYSFPISSIRLGPSLDQESQMSATKLYLQYSTTIDSEIKIEKPESIRVRSAGYELR